MNERNRVLFRGRSRRSSKLMVLLAFFLLVIVCAWATAAQEIASPLQDALKTPSTTAPEFTAEKENTRLPLPDGAHS